MFLGDSGDLRNFALIRFAIQKDPDIHVKFAGLKRIHLFKGHPEFKEMITDLQKDGKGEKMEPYFSMALSKLGIISIEEFERRIKSG
jgi:hypothetical protein